MKPKRKPVTFMEWWRRYMTTHYANPGLGQVWDAAMREAKRREKEKAGKGK